MARWNPVRPDDVLDPSGFDIVIVRRPAAWSRRWHELTTFDGYTAIHADTLMYWEWIDRGEPVEPERPAELSSDVPWDRVERLVRDVFAGYDNHYLSNPLLDPGAALDGYVEWAATTASAVPGAVSVLRADGDDVAFAITDWHAGPPDVRLAGVSTAHQRRGWYPELVRHVMLTARTTGAGSIRISTQAQNVAPQRVWAKLGWRPFEVLTTTHLVRDDLLSAVSANGRAVT